MQYSTVFICIFNCICICIFTCICVCVCICVLSVLSVYCLPSPMQCNREGTSALPCIALRICVCFLLLSVFVFLSVFVLSSVFVWLARPNRVQCSDLECGYLFSAPTNRMYTCNTATSRQHPTTECTLLQYILQHCHQPTECTEMEKMYFLNMGICMNVLSYILYRTTFYCCCSHQENVQKWTIKSFSITMQYIPIQYITVLYRGRANNYHRERDLERHCSF